MRNRSAVPALVFLCSVLFTTHARAGDFEVKFGLLKKDDQGRYYVYKETTNLSLISKDKNPEYRFGYTIKGPSDRQFTTYAAMHFPSAAQQYSGEFKDAEKKSGGNIIQLPSKTSIDNFAYSFRFDKGDPPGQYKIDIWINDTLARTIDFIIIEAK